MKSVEEFIAPIASATSEPTVLGTLARPGEKMRSNWLLHAALLAAWLGAAAVALYLKRTQLLVGFDGGYMLNLAHRQFEWHLPLLSASIDWFQGLGDVFFGINFRLLPAFVAGSFLASTTASKVVIYEVILCELSISIVLFGLALGASRAVSIAAALTTCVALLPFYHPTLIYGILPLIPHLGSLIGGTLLAGAAFLYYGRNNWLADLPYALLSLALLGWSVLVSITIFMLAAPFLFLCAVSGTIAAASPAERRCKIGLTIAAGLFMAAAGPAIYLVGTIADTAAVIFPEELANNRASFFYASILFHWSTIGPVGPVLMVSGIAGAVLVAFDRSNQKLRIFGITLLTYLSTRLTFAVLVILFDFWRGPAALYFEFFVIPLYALFAAVFWSRILRALWRRRGGAPPNNSGVELVLTSTAIITVLALAIGTSKPDYGFPYPPRSTPITDILARETGLRPGVAFRGRTADMIGLSLDGNIDWLALHGIDGALANETGNELRLVGLHHFGIPGLFQYTSTISPFFYAMTSRLLAVPGEKQMRSVIVLRDLDPRILAMLGVRFVITDRRYDGPAALRATVPTKERTLFLYEIGKTNVGDYSPTSVSRIATATDIVAHLADPDFDPAREIVADLPGDTKGLTPARGVRLTFLGASLRLQADSDGRSILLVPLEFSRCLQAKTAATEKPLLFRANLVETGILFSRRLDTTLTLRTGPFIHPACRLRDFQDARELGVGQIPLRAAQPKS